MLMSEDYSNYFGGGAGISRNWATVHILVFFVVGFRTVTVPVGALLKLLMCYNPRVLRLEVDWLALVHHLESSLFQPIYFMSSTAMPFFLKIVPCSLPVSQETKSGGKFCSLYRADLVLTHTQISSLPKL